MNLLLLNKLWRSVGLIIIFYFFQFSFQVRYVNLDITSFFINISFDLFSIFEIN